MSPVRCGTCNAVLIPGSMEIVREEDGTAYHREHAPHGPRCPTCRWRAKDEGLFGEHTKTVHPPAGPTVRPQTKADVRAAELRNRQNTFIEQLQRIEPARPIEVQHAERDTWHPWTSCTSAGCGTRALWTRGILRSEVVWDCDQATYGENFRVASVLHGVFLELGIPHDVYSTGSKGIHVCVYLKLSEGATDETARRIREAVWESVMEAGAILGIAKVDRAKVGWTSRSMLHAWGGVRKAPYTFMDRPRREQPTTLAMPPAPAMWDPSALPGVRQIAQETEHRSHGHLDAATILEAREIDPTDFAHYPFLRMFCEPPSDHDGAFVSLALFLKTIGVPEDQAVAYFAAYWKPKGDCHSPAHEDGPALSLRIRNLYASKWTLKPSFAYKQLKAWGHVPDPVVWRVLFRRLPLELAPNEKRRAEGCGTATWAPCASCGREVPFEVHCRTTLVCPDCQQHRWIVSRIASAIDPAGVDPIRKPRSVRTHSAVSRFVIQGYGTHRIR